MAAPIYIPSSAGAAASFKPNSVAVITTSYTVPAGSFAKVLVNLEGSATLTVNGNTAIRGTQNSVLASDNLRTATGGGANTSNALFTTTSDGSTGAIGSVFNETTDQKTVTSDIFVPSGTVISGTGTWRATVMLYTA
jgi:hypothetical protein